MSASSGNAEARFVAPMPSAAPALRRLFLTLFLRGRSSRGLRKESAPRSVGSKLALTLGFYALFGCFVLVFIHQPVFALSIYLHGMTFAFLGMFVAASAGEILFNKEEADILLHRPVTPRELLWAKIRVLVEVSLWLAGALNLAGFFVGLGASDGGWLFPLAHAFSTTLEALFCTGCVVLAYQLCLRWFGRERLDGLMTTAQVFVAIAAVLAGQILPRLIFRFGRDMKIDVRSWWIGLLPPAWFAGWDDAVAGTGAGGSWLLAGAGIVATALVLWLAFGKLAADYGTGLQRLGDVTPAKPGRPARRRWLHALVNQPPLSWWFRDSVTRASFLLTAAYLLRDRDVKLRVYPGLAPVLVMPVIFLLQSHGHGVADGFSWFWVSFTGVYLGLVPMMGLSMLQYSQQWQASDLFRAAPMAGPSPLCTGARNAVLLLLALPILVLLTLFTWLVQGGGTNLLLLLPGVIALPIFALIPGLTGNGVPLSRPTEEARSAGRGLVMMAATFASFPVAGLASWSWYGGWFKWFLGVEMIVVVVLYFIMRGVSARARWDSME